MSWFDRILGRKQVLNSADLARLLIGGSSSKAGQAVTLDSALRVSAVLGCGRVVSEGLAATPCKLFQSKGDQRTIQADHAAHRLIAVAPNDWMTSFELLEHIGLHLMLAGNAYVLITRNDRGEVLELLPLEPGWVTVKQHSDWSLEYRVRFPGTVDQSIAAANMWHIRGPSWSNYTGLDMVLQAREAIGLSLATEEYGARLFSNGARPGGVLSTSQPLDEAQQKLLRSSWAETQEGPKNAMRTAILGGGLTYTSLAMSSIDAQHIDQRRYAVEEICRFMRVLPIMVGHSGDKTSTYASVEQMLLAHDVYTMIPWYSRIEQSANKILLSADERKAGYYFKFISNSRMRGAAKDRADFYAKALGAGGSPAWMTPDEVRGLEDMNPMGGDAAMLPKPTNVAPSPAA